MPYPVHHKVRPGSIPESKGLHAYHRHMKAVDHKNDKYVSEKKPRDGNQQIRNEGCAPIVEPSPKNGCTNPHWKRQSPGNNGAHDEKGQTV